MNRRSFFRVVAGALIWAQTKHLAWAFPQRRGLLPNWTPHPAQIAFLEAPIEERFSLFRGGRQKRADAFDVTYRLGGRL